MAYNIPSCETTKQLFISYSHADKIIVHKIADELEKLHYKVWIDINDLGGGEIISDEIRKGINYSHLVIPFISKSYCESEACEKELRYSDKIKKKIFPIMLERIKDNEVDYLIQ